MDAALHRSPPFDRAAAARTLLAMGAGFNLRCGPSQWPVIGHLDLLRATIERGAHLGAKDKDKNTACRVAVPANQVGGIDDVLAEGGAIASAISTPRCTLQHSTHHWDGHMQRPRWWTIC